MIEQHYKYILLFNRKTNHEIITRAGLQIVDIDIAKICSQGSLWWKITPDFVSQTVFIALVSKVYFRGLGSISGKG
jgi:hypothetical protein